MLLLVLFKTGQFFPFCPRYTGTDLRFTIFYYFLYFKHVSLAYLLILFLTLSYIFCVRMVHTDTSQLTFYIFSFVSIETVGWRNMSLVAIELNDFM